MFKFKQLSLQLEGEDDPNFSKAVAVIWSEGEDMFSTTVKLKEKELEPGEVATTVVNPFTEMVAKIPKGLPPGTYKVGVMLTDQGTAYASM